MSHIADMHRQSAAMPRLAASAVTSARDDSDHARWYSPHEISDYQAKKNALTRSGAAKIEAIAGRIAPYCEQVGLGESAIGPAYLLAARKAGSRELPADPDELEYILLSPLFYLNLRHQLILERTPYNGAGAREFSNYTRTPDHSTCVFDRLADPGPTPDELASTNEELAPLRAAIARLPEIIRRGLKLALDGHSMETIAARLHLSTIQGHIKKALWWLGAEMGLWGFPIHKRATSYPVPPLNPPLRDFRIPSKLDRAVAVDFTTVEDHRHGVTVIYSVEEDGRPSVIELEAAATNVAHIEIAIYRPSAPPTIERIAKGKRRTILCAGIYKIEACSKKRGQKVSVTSDAEELPEPQRLFSLTEVGKILGIEAQEVVPTMERFLLSPTAGPGGFPHYTKDCLSRVREHLERINAPTDDSPEELLPTTSIYTSDRRIRREAV